jgi:metal-responsive CopG/Arc/MetJ family transcriptional regulator
MKELISIRLKSDLIKKIESLKDEDIRNRTNMIEKLIDEALKYRENNKHNKGIK